MRKKVLFVVLVIAMVAGVPTLRVDSGSVVIDIAVGDALAGVPQGGDCNNQTCTTAGCMGTFPGVNCPGGSPCEPERCNIDP